MRDWNCKIDVTHALAPNDTSRDFDTALLTHDAVVANAFILSAETLEVLGGTKDAFAE